MPLKPINYMRFCSDSCVFLRDLRDHGRPFLPQKKKQKAGFRLFVFRKLNQLRFFVFSGYVMFFFKEVSLLVQAANQQIR